MRRIKLDRFVMDSKMHRSNESKCCSDVGNHFLSGGPKVGKLQLKVHFMYIAYVVVSRAGATPSPTPRFLHHCVRYYTV